MQITVIYSSGCYSPALSLSDTGSYIYKRNYVYDGGPGVLPPENFGKSILIFMHSDILFGMKSKNFFGERL